MSVLRNKTLIRQQIQALKKQYSHQELKQKSIAALSKIELLEIFREAKTVLVYWSLPDEVFTHDFAVKWSNHKTILLPAIKNSELEIRKFTCHEDLQQGAFCTSEPCGNCFSSPINIAIIPGIAFDSEGNRLGRGKGFYDKFLSDFNGYKIGLCFDFQLIDSVPAESFDVKMDCVISN